MPEGDPLPHTPLCGTAAAGFLLGGFGQACIILAFDERNGNVTVGTTETLGLGMQTPAFDADGTMQLSSARSVDQLGGTFGYGGLAANGLCQGE